MNISCICLTYGRPDLLEEAINSFLLQDYNGEKELVILNDYKEQTLYINHPQIKIFNFKDKFLSLGHKRNWGVSLCTYDNIMVWDDDDIYLPHRISYSVEMYQKFDKGFFKSSKALTMNDGVISGPHSGLFHSGSMWSKQTFCKVGGYPFIDSGEDYDFEIKVENLVTGINNKNFDDIDNKDIFYIYRWNGTNSYHISLYGRNKDEETGSKKVEQYVNNALLKNKIKRGDIILTPNYKKDYEKLVTDFLNTIQ